MKTYITKSNLKHDGTNYPKGSEVSLEDAVATKLLADGIIRDPQASSNEDEEAETVTPQPPVNEVNRKDGDASNQAEVTPGKVESPQPGDEDDNDNAVKAQYKVLSGLEFPRGTVHEVVAMLELTEVEAGNFAEGLLEKVVDEDNL